jgi:hypothetical protein
MTVTAARPMLNRKNQEDSKELVALSSCIDVGDKDSVLIIPGTMC